MYTLSGTSALSTFRIQKLITDLQVLDPNITDISAHFIHFVELSTALSTEQSEILNKLLTYGAGDLIQVDSETLTYWVTPRPGTISPWSSKAT